MQDNPHVVSPAESADELRAEFRTAQRRRLLHRGIVVVRDTEVPDRGPQRSADTPPPVKTER